MKTYVMTPRAVDTLTASALNLHQPGGHPDPLGRSEVTLTDGDREWVLAVKGTSEAALVRDVTTGLLLEATWADCGGACRCALAVKAVLS